MAAMCESGSVDVVRVGLIGCGTVGAAFARTLRERRSVIAARYGVWLELVEVAVAHERKARPALQGLDVTVHGDACRIVRNDGLDVIVEASTAPEAGGWIRGGLARGAAVVTANKAALANDVGLLAALNARDSRLWCEAAVGGAVPVVRGVRESLAGTEITAIRGVLNGTTTFVLSEIEERGVSFDDAVRSAQRAGYAEADPTADLSGDDAAAKLAILSTLAWGEVVTVDDIIVRGVSASTRAAFQDQAGCHGHYGVCVRLVASAARSNMSGVVRAFVTPQVLRPDDALFGTRGVENAVDVETVGAGHISWRGLGAGGAATASALLADTVAAARVISRSGVAAVTLTE
jgi:homoserine dehydrogenase